MSEKTNEAITLIAKAIRLLEDYNVVLDDTLIDTISYLKQAIDKLAV
jgi:hypothetical protein